VRPKYLVSFVEYGYIVVETHICCGGVSNRRTSPSVICCGKSTYESTKQGCCQANPYERRISLCCGGRLSGPSTMLCIIVYHKARKIGEDCFT